MEPAFCALSKTLEEHGRRGPSIVFTDNPVRDKAFFMDKFSSLRENQERLDKIAKEMNGLRRTLLDSHGGWK